MPWQRVAKTSDVREGQGLAVRVGSMRIGIYRIGADFFAIDDVCPHAGAPISGGYQDGHMAVCGAHGWEFDVRSGIGEQNGFAPPLACFKVRVEADELWLDVPGGSQ